MRVTNEQLQEAVRTSTSMVGVLRALGKKYSGGNWSYYKDRAEVLGCDMSHFTGQAWNRGKRTGLRVNLLVRQPINSCRVAGQRLRRALLELGRVDACEQCGLSPLWQDKPLVLQVDHLDGDIWNNIAENLRILCPNCHTQTANYAGRANTSL